MPTTSMRTPNTCPHRRALIVSQVLDGGESPSRVAELFRITPSTVHKWLRRFREGGTTGSRRQELRASLHPAQ